MGNRILLFVDGNEQFGDEFFWILSRSHIFMINFLIGTHNDQILFFNPSNKRSFYSVWLLAYKEGQGNVPKVMDFYKTLCK